MILRSKVPGVAKCGFLILLLACASVVLSLFYFAKEEIENEDKPFEDELQYFPKPFLPFSREILDKNFDACLFAPLTLDLSGTNMTVETLFPTLAKQNASTAKILKIKNRPVFPVLKLFTDLMSLFRIDLVLIEPSVIFCMLSPYYKSLLLRRKFSFKDISSSKHVVTLGIRGIDAVILKKVSVKAKIKAYGFKMEIVKEPLLDWMEMENFTFSENHFISHAFFKHKDWIIHLVVFYERGNFLWHSSLKIPPNVKRAFGELNFAESASAYENFAYESLGFKEESLSFINIPSSPQYFLFEMENSKFLECNSTVVSSFLKLNRTGIPNKHSSLSVERFNKRTAVGLQELKAVFNPLLMHFWIWSGTMLGWYRQCGVIPYTSDVDFGSWASEVDDLDEVLHRLEKSEHLQLKQRMGIAEQ
ncbi:fukutin [Nephila pilipes]|uniref:Fukutin n=1 Tax=Nephila pilipes TaxID=299642 RepID=A0A8X6TNM6_NEPPI|nr:fukutin [Nephila pilipes]